MPINAEDSSEELNLKDLTATVPGRPRIQLTRLAVTAGLVVAGVGVALATGPPAYAEVKRVSAVAAPGVVSQFAFAQCDAGDYLTGASGGISGGGGDVTLTDIIPNLANMSVTVWGHINPGGAPGYTVVAEAICAPGAPPADYQLVDATDGPNADPNKAAVANCPGDTRLMGTGMELREANGNAFYRSVLPDFALTSNTVRADASGGFASDWELIAYAICGTPPGAAPVRDAQAFFGGPSSVDAKNQKSGTCSVAGTVSTGVGGAASSTDNIAGFVFLNRISANLAQTEATAEAVEGVDPGAGVAWDLAVYNICWDL
jgi:hypothetical protein